MLSNGQIVGLIMQMVFSLVIPITFIIIWKKKTKVSLKPFFLGMTCFIVFALILENILHYFALISTSIIVRNTVLYILYGILAAGIFEETGRFIYFKIFNKIISSKDDSVSFGIGHGGIECILILGLTSFSNFMIVITTQIAGIDHLSSTPMSDEQALVLSGIVDILLDTPIYTFYLGIYERIVAIVIHTALTILVFISVKYKSKIYFYPIAIILHALYDLPAMLYQRGIIENQVLVEGLFTIMAILVAILAKKVYNSISIYNEQIEMAD